MSTRKSSVQRVAELVDPLDIDLGGRTSPDGAMTILFTDIEGSTEMVERLGDEQWVRVLRMHNALIRDSVERSGGTEVKAQGDGFMLAFGSARAGLRCAVDIQRLFASQKAAHVDETIRVRIGVHSGFMIREGLDYLGRNVILAARIADRARGGEILVSEQVREFIDGAAPARFQGEQSVVLKGLVGRHNVYSLDWSRPRENVATG